MPKRDHLHPFEDLKEYLKIENFVLKTWRWKRKSIFKSYKNKFKMP